jgi:hypothetical protein
MEIKWYGIVSDLIITLNGRFVLIAIDIGGWQLAGSDILLGDSL